MLKFLNVDLLELWVTSKLNLNLLIKNLIEKWKISTIGIAIQLIMSSSQIFTVFEILLSCFINGKNS